MKQGSTILLRGVVALLGSAALAIYVFALPQFSRAAETAPETAAWRYMALVGWYGTAPLVFLALHQTWTLLGLIDRRDAFSERSARALQVIMRCAVAGSALFTLSLPMIYVVAQMEDAPGVMLMGLLVACAPLALAVFVAVLLRLLREAIGIKTENDSTI